MARFKLSSRAVCVICITIMLTVVFSPFINFYDFNQCNMNANENEDLAMEDKNMVTDDTKSISSFTSPPGSNIKPIGTRGSRAKT